MNDKSFEVAALRLPERKILKIDTFLRRRDERGLDLAYPVPEVRLAITDYDGRSVVFSMDTQSARNAALRLLKFADECDAQAKALRR